MATYSHSRLSTFEQCPLKYKLQYIEKPEVEAFDGIDAFLGSRVHDALEQLYKDVQMGRVMTADALVADFLDRWRREWHEGVRIVHSRYAAEDYLRLGEKCLRDYHRRHHPFDTDRTLGTEVDVRFSLDGKGGHQLYGKIDRLAQEGEGRFAIHDYKTSKRLPMQGDLDEDRQLALYQIGVQERFPDAKRVRLVWHYVVHDRAMHSERTPEALEALRAETVGLIDRIEAETRFEPHETPLCDWCPYQALCPIKGHKAKVKMLPAEEFLKEGGVALVNRLVKAKADAAAIRDEAEEKAAPFDAEIEQVREALIAYARKHKVQAVRGSAAEARVSEKEAWKFPGKREEGRAALEAHLRKAGLWDGVSTLDVHALAAALEDPRAPEAMKEAGRWGEQVVDARVTIRKVREE